MGAEFWVVACVVGCSLWVAEYDCVVFSNDLEFIQQRATMLVVSQLNSVLVDRSCKIPYVRFR